jgi:hypothetical protein
LVQGVQAPALAGEDVPAGQMVQIAEPIVEKRPAGHATHVDAAIAPSTLELVPAAHRVHAEREIAPVEDDHEPLGHLLQVADPVKE